MSQSTAVIILMALFWLITVACFLLWVRHLRVKYSREVVAALVNKAAESLSEPYKPSTLPAMTAPIVKRASARILPKVETVYLLDEATEQIKAKADAERNQPPLPRIPRGWKKADGKTKHVKRGRIDIMMRDGIQDLDVDARGYHLLWNHNGTAPNWDIIAYRVCKPKKRKAVTVKKRGAK